MLCLKSCGGVWKSPSQWTSFFVGLKTHLIGQKVFGTLFCILEMKTVDWRGEVEQSSLFKERRAWESQPFRTGVAGQSPRIQRSPWIIWANACIYTVHCASRAAYTLPHVFDANKFTQRSEISSSLVNSQLNSPSPFDDFGQLPASARGLKTL